MKEEYAHIHTDSLMVIVIKAVIYENNGYTQKQSIKCLWPSELPVEHQKQFKLVISFPKSFRPPKGS